MSRKLDLMARWEPNGAERLARAALELFAERGYDNTTVVDIAQRAGLGKTTFFRHFQDKREVLFGGGAMNDGLAQAIAAAPASATPFEAVVSALATVGREVFTPARRETIASRRAVINGNPELQEREALKNLGLAASMTAALQHRGAPSLDSRLAADLGALACTIALERWSEAPDHDDFGEVLQRTVADVVASGRDLIARAPIDV